MMKPFHDINSFLCRLLEVVNVLITLPLAALIYMICLEEVRALPPVDEMSAYIIAGFLTLISVALVNGGIALALERRRFLEALSQSVDALDHDHERGPNTSSNVKIITPQPTKAKAKDQDVKTATPPASSKKT